jgi:probable HAF family extracellular repeat protein
MSLCKTSGRAVIAALSLVGGTTGSAHAQCYLLGCATEWSNGRIINLGGLLGSKQSFAWSINDAGQVVGVSYANSFISATEWSNGRIINLGGLMGGFSVASAINDAGEAVGVSNVGKTSVSSAVEWSGGSIINLGALRG